MSHYCICEFGAVADTQVNSAAAIQRAINAAHGAGGGTVVVPAGKIFMCGSIVLKSDVCLYLEPGSCLQASPDISEYVNYEHLELFRKSDFCRFWIFAQNAERISIAGSGTLDGNSPAFVIERLETHTKGRNPRAQSVVFLGCRDVTVRGIRIIQTPSWALRPAGCDRVLIEGITILNDLGLVNSDGIDVDCSRSVRIAHCHIEAGDDAISIKGRREISQQYGACEDITITGCVLESHCCAFRLGCESFVDFRRIVFSSSTIRRSHRGIAIDCRDEAVIEDILITDIVVDTIHSPRIWWHEGEPIWISQVPYVPGHYGDDSKVARLRNIIFRNISITAEQGIYVQGADGETHPSDILFENVHIHLKKHTQHPVGFLDPRPNRPGFAVAGSLGYRGGNTLGFTVSPWRPGVFLRSHPRYYPAPLPRNLGRIHARCVHPRLEAYSSPGLVLENFSGTAAHPNLPAVVQH
ncbi:MAG: glycosyl hydrolase family 28 protein [Verrucomicrobia bacterium]|nr:glycosyl hydrolase family 28 protein [Verrucomicrobiota bacterium]